jgi:siroheme synthase
VHVVDASHGDPELLTIKAHRLLQSADLIVHDRAVSKPILAMARRDAARIVSSDPDLPIELAREGRIVVRLCAVEVDASRTTPAFRFEGPAQSGKRGVT